MRVPSSIPNREQGSHEWLEDEAKMQRPVQPTHEMLKALGKVVHPLSRPVSYSMWRS
jgi:hypothetical protein